MNKDTLLLITSDKILKIIKSHSCKVTLFREQDSNLRPLDYETNKLPTAPSRDIMLKKYHLLSQVSGITITVF